ncbi:MAG TPA: ABC transporter permease [Lachnospiraceae bacterium]|nr:ABC transporter permease [Lachnospiraceae bacterium]
MLAKLAYRNMKRSARDYLVYIFTMTVVTALMYAFGSLIFENTLPRYAETAGILEMMTGLATFFIVLIVAWLINYMVRFMLEKRSSEFGIYLLLGMKKKEISRLYMRENLLLGGTAFLFGLALGILLRQVLMAVLFAMMRMEYRLGVSFHPGTLLTTVLCYAGCYLLALLRCRRKFRKMNIHDLMNAKRRNEEIRERGEGIKRLLLPLSVLFIFAFWTVFAVLDNTGEIVLFLVGLVLTIYLFYVGVSAWVICYVRKKGNAVYKGQNLFLLRQFASKVRTMQFTMGTLTALFTIALLGASVALMFSDYENTVLEDKFPFDVQLYSPEVQEDFADEMAVLQEQTKVLEARRYHIYTDQSNQVNAWMLTHLRVWGTMFRKEDGTPDREKIEAELKNGGAYCASDTYMGLSDYNALRAMLGYSAAALGSDEYLIQVKSRLAGEVQGMAQDLRITDRWGEGTLSCAGICADAFSQDGHNGGDYVIVVPDEVLGRMQLYYSELAADIDGTVPADLGERMNKTGQNPDRLGVYAEAELRPNECYGSDMIIAYAEDILVRDNLIPAAKYMLASVIIPLFYIGLVFVCVAVTVLSVQQLSDSAKYKFRYDILAKLGLERVQIHRLIRRQLAAYYLCPAVLGIVISGKMILFMSGRFVEATGVPVSPLSFFIKSILLFFGIYLVYYVVTYISFIRNVDER